MRIFKFVEDNNYYIAYIHILGNNKYMKYYTDI